MSKAYEKIKIKAEETKKIKQIEYKLKNIIKYYEEHIKDDNDNEVIPYQIQFLEKAPGIYNKHIIYFIKSKSNKKIFYNFYFKDKWKIYGKHQIDDIDINKINQYFKYREYVYLPETEILMTGNKKTGYTPLFLDDKGLKVLDFIEKLNSQKG